MGDSAPKKGGKNMTTSPTRKARYAEYKNHKTREKHKIQRVLRSSGAVAADVYARARLMAGYLASILKG